MSSPVPRSAFSLLAIAILPLVASIVFGSFYVYHEKEIQQGDLDPDSDEGLELYGYRLFLKRCVGCHGLDRKFRGPTLIEINANSAKRKPELSEEEYLLESMMEPSKFRVPGYSEVMPDNVLSGLNAEDIRALIYFIMSKTGRADREKIAALKITPKEETVAPYPPASLAQIRRGRLIYDQKGACIKCHLLIPEVGFDLTAPSIFGVGLLEERELHDAIFAPNKKINKEYVQATIRLADGTLRKGRVLYQDDKSITILEEDEQGVHPVTIDLSADQEGDSPEVKISEVSSMPGNYAELLTPAEQADLLAFLRTFVTPR